MSTDNEMSGEKNQILSVIDECTGKNNWDLKSQKYGIWGFLIQFIERVVDHLTPYVAKGGGEGP